MARPLALAFDTEIRPLDDARRTFELEAGVHQITLRGHLSTGSRGWRLRAEAARRRWVITLNVTAIEVAEAREPDLEHHEYEARITVPGRGRYSVRVAHAFIPRDEPGQGLPRPVFEDVASIGDGGR